MTLKATNAVNVFNMLQDMRHLIILDFRSESMYSELHLRKSLNVSLENYKDQLVASMVVLGDERFRSHYQGDDLRRVLYVLPENDS